MNINVPDIGLTSELLLLLFGVEALTSSKSETVHLTTGGMQSYLVPLCGEDLMVVDIDDYGKTVAEVSSHYSLSEVDGELCCECVDRARERFLKGFRE